MYWQAFKAPIANTSLEDAVCFNSIVSPAPANKISCSPTIEPPRIACIPISFFSLFAMPSLPLLNIVSDGIAFRSEEHTSELQSRQYLVCRLLLEKKKKLTLNLL